MSNLIIVMNINALEKILSLSHLLIDAYQADTGKTELDKNLTKDIGIGAFFQN